MNILLGKTVTGLLSNRCGEISSITGRLVIDFGEYFILTIDGMGFNVYNKIVQDLTTLKLMEK